jgi:arylsulfatase A-like enzyme
MIESMDSAVGNILKTLDELKLAKDTVVIFTSDNGPHGAISRAEPLRGTKGMYYEGGIREPFLMRYPGQVAAGTKNETPVAQIDLYPTFLEMAGAEVPARLDGVSLLSLFKGEKMPERALFWHFPAYLQSYKADPDSASKFFRTTPCGVIRKGDWKLIKYFENGAIELYNLKEDLSERNNLAEKQPEKAKALVKELEAWQVSTDAPIPKELNPKYQE